MGIRNQSTIPSRQFATVACVFGLIKELQLPFKFAEAKQTTFSSGDMRSDPCKCLTIKLFTLLSGYNICNDKMGNYKAGSCHRI